jgi:hypothetical protein
LNGLLVQGARRELSEFRDVGADVWAYCQGEKGQGALDRHLA